jgi:hypothetical protein
MLELWIPWACLGGFVTFYALRVLADTTNLFSPPLIVAILIYGILVKSYFDFDNTTLAALLDHDAYVMTLWYAILCMIVFCFSYEQGVKRRPRAGRRRKDRIDGLSIGFMSLYVTVIAAIGLAAQVIVASYSGGLANFYSQAHGAAGKFDELSNYLTALPNFLWTTILISYVIWLKGGRGSRYLLLVFCVVGVALFGHTFLFGNRNGIIRFCIILGAAYTFLHRPSLVKSVPLVATLAFGVACVSVIADIRGYTHLGSKVSLIEALAQYADQMRYTGGKTQLNYESAGHEFFFNVAVVQAAWRTGIYDYGAQYIYPIINFVPRGLWPEKPTEINFVVDYFALTSSVTGWDPGAGSAASCIGLSFLAFSWLGCIPWAIFAYSCGRVFRSAIDRPSLMNLGFLISALLACVYWGTQSFSSVFSAWFFTMAPLFGLQILASCLPSASPHAATLISKDTPFSR